MRTAAILILWVLRVLSFTLALAIIFIEVIRMGIEAAAEPVDLWLFAGGSAPTPPFSGGPSGLSPNALTPPTATGELSAS